MTKTTDGDGGMTFCITCSDAADPRRVEAIDRDASTGTCVDTLGHRSVVLLDLVPNAVIGADVLVQAGVALCVLPPTPRGEDAATR